MGKLRNILLAGTLSLAIAGCHNVELAELKGTVVNENYKYGSGLAGESHYSFVLDTEYGKKLIEINNQMGSAITKESVDSVLEPGDKISIKIDKKKLNLKYLTFNPKEFLKLIGF